MTVRYAVSIIGALVGLACSDSTAVPALIDGTWTHSDVPGSMVTLVLSAHETTVTGSGLWSGEACCAGTITVTGSIADGAVSLDLVYVTTSGSQRPPSTDHFVGRVSDTRLSGTMTGHGLTSAYAFLRRP